jgi:maltose-binding protein MalE
MRKQTKPIFTIILIALFLSTFAAGCAPAATAVPTNVPPTNVPATAVPTKAPTVVPPTAVPTTAPTEVPPTTAPITPTATATATPLPSVEGTLTIWVNAERAPIMEAAGKAFTAQYNIPVRIQTMGFGDVRNNFNIAAPQGNGPDIIAGAHDWIGQLYSNGLLAPIDLGTKISSFDPIGIKAFTYDGQLVGMPYQVEAVTMYYNKDLVPTPPTTWKGLKDILTKLYADKKIEQGIAFVGGDYYGHMPMFTGFGGFTFGLDANGNYNKNDVGLDSAGAIAFATELDSMIKAGLLHNGITYDVAKDLFLKGKLAFWVNGPWEYDNIVKSGLNFGLALTPKMVDTARPFVGVQGFMINKFSKNLLLAQAFLTEFVATDSVMMDLYKAQFGIPAWIPIRSQINNPAIQPFADSVAVGVPMPAIPEMSAVWNAAGNAITLLYQQKGTPDQIMKDAATAIRALIKP